MRLIDADAFKKYLDDCDCCKNCTDGAKRMYICVDCQLPDCCDYRWERIINEQSTIDAVPVIRCRDCKKYKQGMTVTEWYFCSMTGALVDGQDFCSYGERKDNEID